MLINPVCLWQEVHGKFQETRHWDIQLLALVVVRPGIAMSDDNLDGIWEVTIPLEENSFYWKFRNGYFENWGYRRCMGT